MSIKTQLSVTGIILVGFLASGCTAIGSGMSQTQNVAPKVEKPVQVKVSPNTHKHPANKCTNSITHTHPNGASKHSHRYSCQSKAKKNPNAHRHPANRCTKSIMHTHKSGKKAHTHRYSCQSKKKGNPNTHSHPANRFTKSMRHTHPNGTRKHTHKYNR